MATIKTTIKTMTDRAYIANLRRRRAAIQPPAPDTTHPGLASFVSSNDALDAVEDWLASLVLLNGVPFDHLVANPNLLPQDAIRLFYVDQNWIDALVDGALSVGSQSTAHVAITTALLPELRHEARARTPRIRSRRLGIADAGAAPAAPVWTGFLLRSPVVYAYPGLEVAAFASKQPIQGSNEGNGQPDYEGIDPLPLLRMSRLAPDVLIAIFNGEPALVQINEPPEGLAFGLQFPETTSFQLRGLGEEGTEFSAGEEIPNITQLVAWRDPSRRTADIYATSTNLQAALEQQKAHVAGQPFGPADLALQLITLPEQKKFFHID
jgi:hypothetical protein